MRKVEFNKVLQVALGTLSLGIVIGLAAVLWQGSKTKHLTLAAGSASGESYILGNALRKVVERHYPKIVITLIETGGTTENLEMLENGQAQLATAQSDVLPGPSARIVAVLYDDTFQLILRKDSTVRSFADVRGMRIALPQSGGQFQSFLRVAEHFGLHPADFRFVGSTDSAADEAFLKGEADAIFRVRAIGNPSIQRLVQSGSVRFVPIEHAAAMKINNPAFERAVIPEGGYLGSPPIPAQDLPTVAVHRTLLAHAAANDGAIQAITETLLERRQEVMKEIPPEMAEVRLLLAQVRRPEAQTGLGPPVHPGALSFYNKDKPSFLQANADFVGLILTVILMIGSWIWELKQWMEKQQKKAADQYSSRAVELMASAQEATSAARLDSIWSALVRMFDEAVHDLNADKLSEESFDSFRSVLQIALDVTKERRIALLSDSGEAMSAMR